MAFGGDYNPEQWSREVWHEDVRLMREAGVTIVSLGVFAWGLVETADGVYDWEWFDEIVELLHENGIAIDLATPSAAPPNWLLTAHPEVQQVDQDMHPQHPGSRLSWCPSSPVFRAYATRYDALLAERYGQHPAVRLWHVGNEYGGGNGRCYCDVSAAAFRVWLERRYGDIAGVNAAWGSAVWGLHYERFEEIMPPRGGHPAHNPALELDFDRFSSDELLAAFQAEADVVRARSAAPITTNFMVSAGGGIVDYAQWAQHVDVVSNDHYTLVADPRRAEELAFSADRTRGLAQDDEPWLLMEHSTGGPSWQERNRAKDPGEILRNSLAHVARGSDGALFFQWRASLTGAEQFHSAMVPHAGTQTRVWREIVALGHALQNLAPVMGAPVEPARVAILVDADSAWALGHGLKPHRALDYAHESRLWYSELWNRQVLVDVIPADEPLDGYALVIAPTLFVAGAERATRLEQYVAGGGTLLATYLSGIVDHDARVLPGGYPGALRDLLGVWTEELRPLQRDESVGLDDGTRVTDWTEDTVLTTAEAVLRYTDGPSTGRAAVTRNAHGAGTAWYVSTALDRTSVSALVDTLVSELGLPRALAAPRGVEVVRRRTADGDAVFVINHTDQDASVALSGTDLVSGRDTGPETVVAAGEVAVVLERA